MDDLYSFVAQFIAHHWGENPEEKKYNKADVQQFQMIRNEIHKYDAEIVNIYKSVGKRILIGIELYNSFNFRGTSMSPITKDWCFKKGLNVFNINRLQCHHIYKLELFKIINMLTDPLYINFFKEINPHNTIISHENLGIMPESAIELCKRISKFITNPGSVDLIPGHFQKDHSTTREIFELNHEIMYTYLPKLFNVYKYSEETTKFFLKNYSLALFKPDIYVVSDSLLLLIISKIELLDNIELRNICREKMCYMCIEYLSQYPEFTSQQNACIQPITILLNKIYYTIEPPLDQLVSLIKNGNVSFLPLLISKCNLAQYGNVEILRKILEKNNHKLLEAFFKRPRIISRLELVSSADFCDDLNTFSLYIQIIRKYNDFTVFDEYRSVIGFNPLINMRREILEKIGINKKQLLIHLQKFNIYLSLNDRIEKDNIDACYFISCLLLDYVYELKKYINKIPLEILFDIHNKMTELYLWDSYIFLKRFITKDLLFFHLTEIRDVNRIISKMYVEQLCQDKLVSTTHQTF